MPDNISLTGGNSPQNPVSSNPQSHAVPAGKELQIAGAESVADPASEDGTLPAVTPSTRIPTTARPIIYPIDPLLENKLTQEQSTVLRLVMYGKSLTQAADTAGVSRSTVYRWQSTDPHYMAAVNAWQRQLQDSGRQRLMSMVDGAMASIQAALLSCDAKVALALLKGLGVLSPPTPGSAAPDIVERQIALDRRAEVVEQRKLDETLRKDESYSP